MLSKNNLILYEIYPRSFLDTTGNGYGDLKGVIAKLDYLKELGINTIWLTPFFPSPMKDGGYDITDYCDVADEFGTLDDFRKLISVAHNKEINVIIDLVVNHTSDQHPWFVESRSSKDSPKRDWYIWKDPVKGGVPNNWKSVFEPTPWEFDEATGQYYFHSFLTEQPDLNWTNSEVMQAVKDSMKFWMDLGVNGFRLDAVNYFWKDQRFLDEPKDPDYKEGKIQPFYELKHIYMRDQKEVFPIINELATFASDYGDAIIITEAYLNQIGTNAIPVYKTYYNSIKSKNVIPFNFEFIRIPWNAQEYKNFVTAYLTALDADEVPSFVFGNHDKPRIATRIGPEHARAAVVLLLTLPGIPVIYYGEELGMEDVKIPRAIIHDTKEYTSPGFGRDPVRTPMQWTDGVYAGFSKTTPWLPLEDVYTLRNVQSQKQDPHSMYNLYKTLLHLRTKYPALREGKYEVMDNGNAEVFAYSRIAKNDRVYVFINFSNQKQTCRVPFEQPKMLANASAEEISINNSILILEPFGACVLDGDSFNGR